MSTKLLAPTRPRKNPQISQIKKRRSVVKDRLNSITRTFGRCVCTVTPAEHPRLRAIKEANIPDTYCYLTDIGTQEVIWMHGIERCLGYPEAEFNFEQSLGVIHSTYFHIFLESRLAYFHILSVNGPLQTQDKYTFKCTFPVKKSTGTWMLVKMTSEIFEVDLKGKPVMSLNFFHIIGSWSEGEAVVKIAPRLFVRSIRDKASEKTLYQRIGDNLLNIFGFNKRQLDCMEAMLEHHSATNETNRLTKTEKENQRNVRRSILSRGLKLFTKQEENAPSLKPYNMKEAIDVAVFLRKLRAI